MNTNPLDQDKRSLKIKNYKLKKQGDINGSRSTIDWVYGTYSMSTDGPPIQLQWKRPLHVNVPTSRCCVRLTKTHMEHLKYRRLSDPVSHPSLPNNTLFSTLPLLVSLNLVYKNFFRLKIRNPNPPSNGGRYWGCTQSPITLEDCKIFGLTRNKKFTEDP